MWDLAYIYEYRMEFGLGSAEDNLAKLMETARNAVRLDPNDGETQLVLGHAFAYQRNGGPGAGSIRQGRGAWLPTTPTCSFLIAWYLPQLGQPDRAVALAEKALGLNPNYPYWYNQGFRYVYFFGRQFDKSVQLLETGHRPVRHGLRVTWRRQAP